MEDVSRNTCQDRLTNFTADTNRTPNNTIIRATGVLSKYRYTNEFTNKNKFTKRFSINITDKIT